nr:immunoglobulin heavy chain junction region [Mus musculus]
CARGPMVTTEGYAMDYW